jgi:uncharacterized protein
MHKSAFALSCLLLAGVACAQQKPAAAPSTSEASATNAAAQAAPAHPLTDAQAHEMLEITGGNKIKGQLTAGYMNFIQSRMPFLPKDVSDELQQSLAKMDLDTPIIAVYKQHISTDDAAAIIAFYKTPAGKSMIDALPEILQQQQQLAMQEGRKTADDVIQKHRPEIEAAANKYREEHSPKAPPSLNSPGAGAPSGTAKPSGSSSGGAGATPSTTTTPQPK